MSLGANENRNDRSFKTRVKPPYTSSSCPDIGRKYQWAELKSSLLMKYLVHDTLVQKELVIWLQNLVKNLFSFLQIDYGAQFTLYMRSIATSRQKDKIESYPVGQVKAWAGPRRFGGVAGLASPADLEGGSNNFYVLFNFIKWTWYKLKNKDFYNVHLCQKRPVYAFLFIDLFQQNILVFHDMIRGHRVNLKGGAGGPPNDQIGITNLKSPYLKRKVRGKPTYPTQAWDHPGQVQCRVPYRGKYGTYIKEYREQDSFYASLQCGISGSIQYMLFMYLLSILPMGSVPANPGVSVRNMITSACLILTGDGGHNVREVIFGFTCSIIIMHTFLALLKEEVIGFSKTGNEGPALRSIRGFIGKSLLTIPCAKATDGNVNNEVFHKMVNSILTQWKPFIDTAYVLTRGLNIVGVYTSDLNKFDPAILKNPARSYQIARKWVFDQIFHVGDKFTLIHQLPSYNMVQVFFALEGDRYLLNPKSSFKRAANDIMVNVVKGFPGAAASNILGKVNEAMLQTLRHCTEKKDIDPSLERKIKGDPSNIPLASPRRAGCTNCDSDVEVIVDNEDGYCVECATETLSG